MSDWVKIEMGGRYFPFESPYNDVKLPRATAEAAALAFAKEKRAKVSLVVQDSPEEEPLAVAVYFWNAQKGAVEVREP